MKFVRLTHDVLHLLKSEGYTILQSPMPLTSYDPSWYAMRVDDVWEYLDRLMCEPFAEPNIIIIDDALNSHNEVLVGSVFVQENTLTR